VFTIEAGSSSSLHVSARQALQVPI